MFPPFYRVFPANPSQLANSLGVATSAVGSRIQACVLVSIGVFFAGWAEGLALTATTLAVKDQNQLGSACGFGGSIRFTITTIATTVYNCVLTNRIGKIVPQEVPPALTKAGLSASSVALLFRAFGAGTSDALQKVPGITPRIIEVGMEAYKKANIDAYRAVFYTTIAFAGVGVIVMFLYPDVDNMMTGELTTVLHGPQHEDKRESKHIEAV